MDVVQLSRSLYAHQLYDNEPQDLLSLRLFRQTSDQPTLFVDSHSVRHRLNKYSAQRR